MSWATKYLIKQALAPAQPGALGSQVGGVGAPAGGAPARLSDQGVSASVGAAGRLSRAPGQALGAATGTQNNPYMNFQKAPTWGETAMGVAGGALNAAITGKMTYDAANWASRGRLGQGASWLGNKVMGSAAGQAAKRYATNAAGFGARQLARLGIGTALRTGLRFAGPVGAALTVADVGYNVGRAAGDPLAKAMMPEGSHINKNSPEAIRAEKLKAEQYARLARQRAARQAAGHP